MIPRDQASRAAVATPCLPPERHTCRTSGAAYASVKLSGARSPMRAAHPKSISVHWFSRGSHITLAGLRSRCTYPAACMSSSRLATFASTCAHCCTSRMHCCQNLRKRNTARFRAPARAAHTHKHCPCTPCLGRGHCACAHHAYTTCRSSARQAVCGTQQPAHSMQRIRAAPARSSAKHATHTHRQARVSRKVTVAGHGRAAAAESTQGDNM
jgi:hypothetical protein